MASEVFSAREASVSGLNSASSTSAARRQANPFRGMALQPLSDERRSELQSDGVNMRIYEQLRREEHGRRVDYEYERQVRRLRDELREKYPDAEWADRAFTTDKGLIAQAKAQRAAYNREYNQGVRRLRRLAAAAKKK